jgi:hypothetical protein
MSLYTHLSYFDCREIWHRDHEDCSQHFIHTYTCNHTALVNLMATRMIYNEPFMMECQGIHWGYNNSILCANCQNSTSLERAQRCTAQVGKAVIPATVECQQHVENTTMFNITKFTSVLTLRQSVVIGEDVPKIGHIDVVAREDNMTVNINSTCMYPGCKFYCAAFPVNTTIATVRSVVSNGISRSFPTNNIYSSNYSSFRIELAGIGLVPLESYDVYCYGEDSIGSPSSLDMVLATKVTSKTLCCKDVIWSNTPSYVYSDSSRYAVGTASTNYVFSYTLIAAPETNITVLPYVSEYNSSANFTLLPYSSTVSMLTFTPANYTFTSNSNGDTLMGSFVISSSNSAAQGTFSLSLSITGANRNDFETSSVTFELLSGISNPLPPQLSSAIFANNGATATIYFDSDTDYGITLYDLASLPVEWDCGLLFVFQGSQTSVCTWLSANAVKVHFPAMDIASTISLLLPPAAGHSDSSYSTISLKSGTVKAACVSSTDCTTYTYASGNSIIVNDAVAFDPPIIKWNMPIEISYCDNLTIDATGSSNNGGRPWSSVIYTASTNKYADMDEYTSLTAINAVLSTYTTTPATLFSIPGDLFNTSLVYYFQLSLKNYYGSTTESTVAVLRSDSTDIPQLRLVGDAVRDVVAKSALNIRVVGLSSSTCSGSSANAASLSYRWLSYKNEVYDASLLSESKDPRIMALSAYTLETGSIYRFTAFVTSSLSGRVANTSADVYVLNGAISTVIGGGNVCIANHYLCCMYVVDCDEYVY